MLDTGLWIDCSAPSAHPLSETCTYVEEEEALSMVCILTVFWVGQQAMTNISTLLVFRIPWHHGGSGVVCCRVVKVNDEA
jgi:hypothetical protein